MTSAYSTPTAREIRSMTILNEMKICTMVSSFTQRARRGASVGPKVVREGDEKVVDKAWPPMFDAKLLTLAFFICICGKTKLRLPNSGCLSRTFGPPVEPPIPERKDENVR